jgi:hypothetical protein
MKIIKNSSPEEAVLAWLKAELNSDRFSHDLKTAIDGLDQSEVLITEPNLDDVSENEMRWKILKNYRTWLDRDFDDYDWKEVELNKGDVADLDYIDYSYWNELSDNTRKVGRAANNISNHKIVFDVPNDRFYSVAKDAERGKDFTPIIVVSKRNDNQGEILEGHLRATGYALSEQTKPLKAIWGELRQ